MSEKVFAEGLILKTIKTQYGELQKLSVKTEEFKEFLDKYDNNGWVNLNIKKSKGGKDYIELDTWKPEEKPKSNAQDDINVDSIPF